MYDEKIFDILLCSSIHDIRPSLEQLTNSQFFFILEQYIRII